jgi:hypothetical protein
VHSALCDSPLTDQAAFGHLLDGTGEFEFATAHLPHIIIAGHGPARGEYAYHQCKNRD